MFVSLQNVINTFTQTALNKRCNFLGNVSIGDDISIEQLRQSYTAVVLVSLTCESLSMILQLTILTKSKCNK